VNWESRLWRRRPRRFGIDKMPPSEPDGIGAITGDRARNWFTCFKSRASRQPQVG
jgi:hypothetical protein